MNGSFEYLILHRSTEGICILASGLCIYFISSLLVDYEQNSKFPDSSQIESRNRRVPTSRDDVFL